MSKVMKYFQRNLQLTAEQAAELCFEGVLQDSETRWVAAVDTEGKAVSVVVLAVGDCADELLGKLKELQ